MRPRIGVQGRCVLQESASTQLAMNFPGRGVPSYTREVGTWPLRFIPGSLSHPCSVLFARPGGRPAPWRG